VPFDHESPAEAFDQADEAISAALDEAGAYRIGGA
jgi:hypothetical protein